MIPALFRLYCGWFFLIRHERADLPPAVRLLQDLWLGSCGLWTSPWCEKINEAEFRRTKVIGAFLVFSLCISKFMSEVNTWVRQLLVFWPYVDCLHCIVCIEIRYNCNLALHCSFLQYFLPDQFTCCVNTFCCMGMDVSMPICVHEHILAWLGVARPSKRLCVTLCTCSNMACLHTPVWSWALWTWYTLARLASWVLWPISASYITNTFSCFSALLFLDIWRHGSFPIWAKTGVVLWCTLFASTASPGCALHCITVWILCHTLTLHEDILPDVCATFCALVLPLGNCATWSLTTIWQYLISTNPVVRTACAIALSGHVISWILYMFWPIQLMYKHVIYQCRRCGKRRTRQIRAFHKRQINANHSVMFPMDFDSDKQSFQDDILPYTWHNQTELSCLVNLELS